MSILLLIKWLWFLKWQRRIRKWKIDNCLEVHHWIWLIGWGRSLGIMRSGSKRMRWGRRTVMSTRKIWKIVKYSSTCSMVHLKMSIIALPSNRSSVRMLICSRPGSSRTLNNSSSELMALHSRNHPNQLHHRNQNKVINYLTPLHLNLMNSPILPTPILTQRRLMHTLSQSTSCKILRNPIVLMLSINKFRSLQISQKLSCMSSSRKGIMMQRLRKKLSESHKRSGN